MTVNISDLLGVGSGSGGLAGSWNMAASSVLPTGHAPGLMYEVTGGEAVRDGQRFVTGDIAMVNLDNSTVVNLTNKHAIISTSVYSAFDTTKGAGVFSNSNKTVATSLTSFAVAQLDSAGISNYTQAEFVASTKGISGTYFIFVDTTDDALNAFMFNQAACLGAVAWLESDGVWGYVSIINNVSSGAPVPLTGLPNLSAGDVVTLGFDKTTRQMRISVNGTEGTFADNVLPGTGNITFGTVGVGGTPQITVNSGPVFQYGYSGYVGVYTSQPSYSGPLRLMGSTWDPTTGFPSYATLLPGDLWYSSGTGTIAGTTYYSGQGIWYDGVTWRRLDDGPYAANGMVWMGDLDPVYGSPSLPAGVLPAVTTADDGKTWRLTSRGYILGVGQNISPIFPANSIVTVKNGKYVLFSYDESGYDIARSLRIPATEESTWFQGKNYSPLVGSGVAYSTAQGQFEITLRRKPTTPVAGDYVGIYMPFALDGTTSQVPMSDGLSLYIDYFNNKLYSSGGGTPTSIYDFATDPLNEGDIITFIQPQYSNEVFIYKNGLQLVAYNTRLVLSADLSAYPYTFALFRNAPVDGTLWYPNSGRTPFAYSLYPTSWNYSAYLGYPVEIKGASSTVLSVNSLQPDINGNINLTIDSLGGIPLTQKANPSGVASLDSNGDLVQKTIIAESQINSSVDAHNGESYKATFTGISVNLDTLPNGGVCYVDPGVFTVSLVRGSCGWGYVNHRGTSSSVLATLYAFSGKVRVEKLSSGDFLIDRLDAVGLSYVSNSSGINLDLILSTGRYFIDANYGITGGPAGINYSSGRVILEVSHAAEVDPFSLYSLADIILTQKLTFGRGVTFARHVLGSTGGSWTPWALLYAQKRTVEVTATANYFVDMDVGTINISPVSPGSNVYIQDSVFTYSASSYDGRTITVKNTGYGASNYVDIRPDTNYASMRIEQFNGDMGIGLSLRIPGEAVTLKYNASRSAWMIIEHYCPPNSQYVISAGGLVSLGAPHYNSYIRITSTLPTNVTVPSDSTYNFPLGHEIPVMRADTGTVTFVADTGVTFNVATVNITAQWDVVVAKKVGANTWDLIGPLS